MPKTEKQLLILTSKRAADTFYRSVFNGDELVERLSFNKETPTAIENELQIVAVMDDIGIALFCCDEKGRIDHDETRLACAEIAGMKMEEAEESGVPATLSRAQLAAISKVPESEPVEDPENDEAAEAARKAEELRLKELKDAERDQADRDRIEKEREEARLKKIADEKAELEAETEKEAEEERNSLLENVTPLSDLEGWSESDLIAFTKAEITTFGQALAHKDLTEIKGVGKSTQSKLLAAIETHAPTPVED